MFLTHRQRVMSVRPSDAALTVSTHRVEVAEVQDGIGNEAALEECDEESESEERGSVVHPELRSCHCRQVPTSSLSIWTLRIA